MTINSLCVFGTRPEAIKMAPLVKGLSENSFFINKVCVTGQHREMLDPVLRLFSIKPDFDLNVIQQNQNLSTLTTRILEGLDRLFTHYKPQLILVHGDTTSSFAATLAAFYNRISVAHIEAGLRTNNLYSPWPEEANRKLTGTLAKFHFAPTKSAKDNLDRENIPIENIYVTGNTVIDALHQAVQLLQNNNEYIKQFLEQWPFLNEEKKIILITGHRRENIGDGFKKICKAILRLAKQFPDINFVYPVHLNPNVQKIVRETLSGINNIYLIEPLDYLPFVYFMQKSYLILTDSGGIQEEAPGLGKPVLVMRETTERPEAVYAGTVKLVGSEEEKIFNCVSDLILDDALYNKMSQAENPYGDGLATSRIIDILTSRLTSNTIKSSTLADVLI